jgi:hypothetical protein
MRDAVHGEGVQPDLLFHDWRLSTPRGMTAARQLQEIRD